VRRLGHELGRGTVEVRPGLTAAATIEAACCTELNRARDAIGKLVTSAVARSNNMRLMTTVACSKGSLLNIAQTIGCVGQQPRDIALVWVQPTPGFNGVCQARQQVLTCHR
jgi:hypothetical protein